MPISWIVLLELNRSGSPSFVNSQAREFFDNLLALLLIVGVNLNRLGLFSFFLIRLNFDLPGNERFQVSLWSQFRNERTVFLNRQVEHGREDVGSTLDELQMQWVVNWELEYLRGSLQPAPEELTRFFYDVVCWEGV